MKASELAEKLSRGVEQHGDLEVKIGGAMDLYDIDSFMVSTPIDHSNKQSGPPFFELGTEAL